MKKLVVMAAVMGLGFAAQAEASYECGGIYWNVYYADYAKYDVSSAKVYCLLGGVNTCLYTEDNPTTMGWDKGWGVLYGSPFAPKEITAAGTYTFIAKLYTDDGDVWTADPMSITFSSSGTFLEPDYGDGADSMNFSSGSWNSVPEPTSGVLLLLGLAGLALKRKQRE